MPSLSNVIGQASRGADLYFVFRFLRLLTMKYTSTNAYKLGIIDKKGKALKKSADLETVKEKSHTKRLSSSTCQNILYDISSSHGKIKIDHLKECTLYTVDVSPVDASGHTIRPSEQFGSVHSTLCPGNKEDSDSGSFWFGDENTSSEKKINGNSSFI